MRVRGLLLGAAVTAAISLLLFGLDRALAHRLAAGAETRESESHETPGDAGVRPAVHPIASEALVFRTAPAGIATDPLAPRRDNAHPRTLATFRRLRAYPGAPPRVPHGLTADEFRGSVCNTCHERGGWSPRFGAYVPLTPHPEWTACLQCHVTDALVMGRPLPGYGADALCRQCHSPVSVGAALPELDWQPAPWPRVRGSAGDGTPPEIPHDLQLRGNCLACHMGPGAVAEIRTTHPERANCRQCHLAPDALSFSTAAHLAGGRSP
jgi:nitrate reductase (cytochrome), electron transfer subunit